MWYKNGERVKKKIGNRTSYLLANVGDFFTCLTEEERLREKKERALITEVADMEVGWWCSGNGVVLLTYSGSKNR